MENFEFKSQICTSVEQSKRLLELGLKKDTADMHITNMSSKGINYTDDWQIGTISYCDVMSFWDSKGLQEKTAWSIIPAWSLHRLIEIIGPHRLPIHFRKKGRVDISVSYIHPSHSGRSGYNYYDSIIDCIAWLINEGYNHFNKDYLEEKK